jgi:hypothetical protein
VHISVVFIIATMFSHMQNKTIAVNSKNIAVNERDEERGREREIITLDRKRRWMKRQHHTSVYLVCLW